MISENIETDTADSWDVEDDPVITPDEDEIDDIDDVEGDATPKVSKKKVPKIEESKSKKEHVNVVFIGHVGKSCRILLNYMLPISNNNHALARCW